MRQDSPHHPHEIPRGYPREHERELRLSDGRTVLIRPIVPADAEQLADAIRTADRDTVRRRFLGGPPHITPTLLAHLCVVDYRKRFALVAGEPRTGRGIALARYETTADGVADVAVAVDPEWRRAGLATALIELLAQAALDRGIHTFSAYYFAENRPVAALLGLAGTGGRQIIKEGFAEAVVALDRPDVDAAVEQLNRGGHRRPSSPRRSGT